MIEKIAVVVKRKGKYCVLSHKKGKDGDRKNFGCYDTKEEANERLQQIHFFKNKKSVLLNITLFVCGKLEDKNLFHIYDIVNQCAEEVASDSITEGTAIKLMKVANLLEGHNEYELADHIDSIIPEVLSFNLLNQK